MRIIAGKFKGRTISMPKGIRPTSDKVREAIFEILKGRIEGADFLDLYSGSGAVGIEALSRGAKSVTFVDNNAGCIKILKKNLALLHISDVSSIYTYKADASNWCRVQNRGSVPRTKEVFCTRHQFDVVFLDPPYYKDMAKNTLIALADCDILLRNAIYMVETYKKDILPEEIGKLKRFRVSKYGDTKLEFYGLKT